MFNNIVIDSINDIKIFMFVTDRFEGSSNAGITLQ